MSVRGLLLVAAALLGLSSGPVSAQTSVEIRATAPEKPVQFHIIEPGPATREVTRPREAEFYGTDVRVRHEPAFIEPFVGQTQGGTKYGLSGWTSPSTPVGAYVARHRLLGSERIAYTAEQGAEVGRPGLVRVTVEPVGDGGWTVRVGGQAVTVLEGELSL